MSNPEPSTIGTFLPPTPTNFPPPAPLGAPPVHFQTPPAPVNAPQPVQEPQPVPQPPVEQFSPQEPQSEENPSQHQNPIFNKSFTNLTKVIENYNKHMVGQHLLRETLLIGLLTGGHILLESVPGLAKTTAAQTLALSVNGKFSRIQCTPDLLPSDIIGTEIFEQKTGSFKTELGPVHANFVLLDEINRSSAKTQSAMLEAMQEKQTSIGGEVYKLPKPFQVIATQNPIEHEGTYPLPEAQLDRFLMKDVLTYSTPEEEFEILVRLDTGMLDSSATEHAIELDDVLIMQKLVSEVYVNDSIRSYIINLVNATRHIDTVLPKYAGAVEIGASVRASISLLQCARAVAFINQRDNVVPEDVKHVAERVLQHRMIMSYDAPVNNITSSLIIKELLNQIPVP